MCLGPDRHEEQRYWNVDVSPLDILGSCPHIYASSLMILLADRNSLLGIEEEILENFLELHALLLFQLMFKRKWK